MYKKYSLSAVAVFAAAFAAFVSFKAVAEENTGVAARVNGEVITIEEIKQTYENNPQIAAQVPFDQFYSKAVDILINGKLVYQAAQKANIEETEMYQKQLKNIKEDLARKVYLEKTVADGVTDEAVKDMYENEYLKKFTSQKEAKAKHILVDDEEAAKTVITRLDNGEDFEKIAKEVSKDASDLGYFSAKMMVKEFSDAAFGMEKGTYSKKPVKTQFGYHVILLEDFRDSKPLSLIELEPQIRGVLSQKVIAQTLDGLAAGDIEKFNLDGSKAKYENPVK